MTGVSVELPVEVYYKVVLIHPDAGCCAFYLVCDECSIRCSRS